MKDHTGKFAARLKKRIAQIGAWWRPKVNKTHRKGKHGAKHRAHRAQRLHGDAIIREELERYPEDYDSMDGWEEIEDDNREEVQEAD